jgi:hypothetical protein
MFSFTSILDWRYLMADSASSIKSSIVIRVSFTHFMFEPLGNSLAPEQGE